MAGRVVAAVWLLHRQFLQQQQEQQGHGAELAATIAQPVVGNAQIGVAASTAGAAGATTPAVASPVAGAAGGSLLCREPVLSLMEQRQQLVEQALVDIHEDGAQCGKRSSSKRGRADNRAVDRRNQRAKHVQELSAVGVQHQDSLVGAPAAAVAVAAAVPGQQSGLRRSQRCLARTSRGGPAGNTQQQQQQASTVDHCCDDDASLDEQLEQCEAYSPGSSSWDSGSEKSDADGADAKPCRTAAAAGRQAKGGAAASKPGKQSSRRSQRQGRRQTGAESPAAAAAGDVSSVCSWDALVKRAWHPRFDEQQVTLQDLVSAVADHQARLQQQLQQQHALPQGQVQGQQDSSRFQQQLLQGSGAAAGVSGLVVRPTRTMARHKACTSCQALRPELFLAHLKGLSWYQDQVGGLLPEGIHGACH